jgi:hypothetical protein
MFWIGQRLKEVVEDEVKRRAWNLVIAAGPSSRACGG